MDNVAALTAGVGVAALDDWISAAALNVPAVKSALIAAFAMNLFAVQVPGRLDGEMARAMKEAKAEGKAGESENPVSVKSYSGKKDKYPPKEPEASSASSALLPSIGKSYITPAGWAFAIWGPIYLGEMIFSAVVGLSKFDGAASEVVKAILPAWISANLFQSLWCATFRPRFHLEQAKKKLGPFVSALFLGLTATSLGKASLTIAAKSSALSLLQKALFVPLTMHFGWTTAATLVNVNGALANYESAGCDRNLYGLGCTSIAAALAASVAVAAKTHSPTYSLVIAWALSAVSSGMNPRIANAKRIRSTAMFLHAKRIRSLSKYAAAASAAVAALTLAAPLFDSAKGG